MYNFPNFYSVKICEDISPPDMRKGYLHSEVGRKIIAVIII